MKLSTVTLTGADDSVNPQVLFEISAKYPFVEWGILLSRNSIGLNRFPSQIWMENLLSRTSDDLIQPNFSGHLCGGYVREILFGDIDFIQFINIWELFGRIQINTHGIQHHWAAQGIEEVLSDYPGKEFIFQYDIANRAIIDWLISQENSNYSTLFDLSHGAGVLPTEWPLPLRGIRCGYAGGLSPDNLQSQLDIIAGKVGDTEIWIDMETHLRSDDDQIFDLKKVEQVLQICQKYF